MRRILVIALVVFALSFNVNAQSVYDLRINEVMIENTSSHIDNYGNRSAWIEIFNTSHNVVSIANCYLTNDINDPKKYRIPAGDPITSIPLRFVVLFHASGTTEYGAVHLNFTLDSAHRFVALFSPDGKTLIDSVTVPPLQPNISYSRMPDGNGAWKASEIVTPNSINDCEVRETAGEKFIRVDPHGIVMTVIAMSVVFAALVLLYLVFRYIGNVNQGKYRRKPKVSGVEPQVEEVPIEQVSGEVFAAISAALYQYETERHDHESEIITIERVSKRYSPWNSKLYGMTQVPQVRHNKR